MTGARDPRINPAPGDYLAVSPRRHVRVESVTQTDGVARVRSVGVMEQATMQAEQSPAPKAKKRRHRAKYGSVKKASDLRREYRAAADARKAIIKIGPEKIGAVMLRHASPPSPYTSILVSVIAQAFQDIATINPPDVVTDAYRFLTQDQRLCPWCDLVGLLPEFIRELAVKGGYLTAEQVNQK